MCILSVLSGCGIISCAWWVPRAHLPRVEFAGTQLGRDKVCKALAKATGNVQNAAICQPTTSALSSPPLAASVSAAFHRNAACSLGVLNTVDRSNRESHAPRNSSTRGDLMSWRKARASWAV